MAASGPPALTPEQAAALSTRDVSVALSAGAGCGKTFVLTRRFLSYLEPKQPDGLAPAALDQLVAITFTERAAREMRDRVRQACREKVLHCDEDDVDYWLGLLRNLDQARISTFHAFCADLLKVHAAEAGIDSRFSVLEESQGGLLRYELAQDVVRDLLVRQQEDLIELVAAYGVDRTPRLILELLDERDRIDFHYWQTMTASELVLQWRKAAEAVWLEFRERLFRLPAVADVVAVVGGLSFDKPALEQRRTALLELLAALRSAGPEDAIWGELSTVATVRGIKAEDCGGEDLYEDLKEGLVALRDEVKKLLKRFAWDDEAALVAAEWGLRLCRCAQEVHAAYEKRKAEEGLLDFGDLVSRARALLADPKHRPLRKRLAGRLRMLLVDEFQDTDPLQAELVMLLLGAEPEAEHPLNTSRLFFVGDWKQSIYRFRGAEPKLFHAMRKHVADLSYLPLSKNFRSTAGILSFVNYLFSDLLERPDRPYEPLRPLDPPEPGAFDVEFLWGIPPSSGRDDEDDSAGGPPKKAGAAELRRCEAEQIASRIQQIVHGGEACVRVKRSQERRPARYGDVVILLRAMSDASTYETALRRAGIPYYVVGGQAFYAQQEIYDLAHLLRAVSRPSDEVSLLGVLRSPFFSISDEGLFWLKRRHGSLAAALRRRELPDELSRDDRERVVRARDVLHELTRLKDRAGIVEFLHRAFDLTGCDAAALTEFLGDRKLANLRKLFDLAREFDQAEIFSLDDFMTQLSEFLARRPPEAPAPTQAEACDVVRIMTIHQSKGLEFPVVVLGDCSRSNRFDTTSVGFSPELGPLLSPPRIDPDAETGAMNGLRILAAQNYLADEEESLRLLYVATTRAADRLILSGGLNGLDRQSSPWMRILERKFDLGSGAMLDRTTHRRLAERLPPSEYAAPQVRVFVNLLPAASDGEARPRPDFEELERPFPADLGPPPPELLPAAPFTHQPSFFVNRSDGAVYWGRLPVLFFSPAAAAPAAANGAATHAKLTESLKTLPSETHDPTSSVPADEAPPQFDDGLPHDPDAFYGSLAEHAVEHEPGAYDDGFPHDAAGLAGLIDSDDPADEVELDPSLWEEDDDLVWLRNVAEEFSALWSRGRRADGSKRSAPGRSAGPKGAFDWMATAEPAAAAVRFLERFQSSPRAAAIAKASRVDRDVEFLLRGPLNAAGADREASIRWLLTGGVSCIYREASGSWVLVEFDFRRAAPGGSCAPERLEAQRRGQLLLAGLSFEASLGEPVQEAVAHALATGEEFILEWNDSVRAEAKAFAGRLDGWRIPLRPKHDPVSM